MANEKKLFSTVQASEKLGSTKSYCTGSMSGSFIGKSNTLIWRWDTEGSVVDCVFASLLNLHDEVLTPTVMALGVGTVGHN